jgi:hypothetical protein
MLVASARLHFADAKAGVDAWRDTAYVAAISDDGKDALWGQASAVDDLAGRLDVAPAAHARFAELPAAAARAASYASWAKSLESHLYQHGALELLACDALALSSRPGETEGDFRARLSLALREKRDAAVEKLREKYASRLTSLRDQLRRAEERVAREQSQYSHQKMQSAISIGATVLGALLGSRRVSTGTLGRATTAARSAGRIGREKEEIARAEENAEVLRQRVAELTADCERDIEALQNSLDPQAVVIRPLRLGPRKSDIAVGRVTLLWVPWQTGTDGLPQPAYRLGR